MKDRLIELLKEADKYASGVCTDYDEAQEVCADYLLANGVIVPPCKVGDTVWFIRNEKIIETKIDKIVLKHGGLYLLLSCNSVYETTCRSIGKTVFITKEEAEKELERRADDGKVNDN